MARRTQAADPARRSPRQARALQTVEAILGAAIQILTARGRADLTTNRIAERAGVSIGTLYQYFANKEAVLAAVARRMLAEDRQAILKALAPALNDPAADLDRVAIREVIRLYRSRPTVRRAVMETLIGLGRSKEVAANVQEVGALLTERLHPRATARSGWAMRLYLATHAVESAVRAAAYEGAPFFATPPFEDALVQMVRGLLPELQNRALR